MQSLSTAMTFITDPESPALFSASTQCYLTFVERTTTPSSKERYELLWSLVADNFIGGAWIYGTRSNEMMETSVESLTPVIRLLGIGSVRFLKVRGHKSFKSFATRPY